MKIIELLNNISLPLTNEEADLLNRLELESRLDKKNLNLRENLIADQLVKKNVISRHKNNETVYFRKKA
jgi:hypothetical protein